MLQLPDSRGAGALGQPGDFRVKLALTVCSGGHQAAPGLNVADCGVCVFCLDKPKFGGPGTHAEPRRRSHPPSSLPPCTPCTPCTPLHPLHPRTPAPPPPPPLPRHPLRFPLGTHTLLAGTKRQKCVLRRTMPTGPTRVWSSLRVVSKQHLQQLDLYSSQVTLPLA